MLMHGTADPFAPYEQSAQEYERAPGPKYFLSLVGAKHIQYSEPWLSISARATIDFFDRYLKNEGGRALQLRTDANVAGKATLQQSRSREQPSVLNGVHRLSPFRASPGRGGTRASHLLDMRVVQSKGQPTNARRNLRPCDTSRSTVSACP